MIVVWDQDAVYETFNNTLQFYGGKTRQTIPLGKQYVISLTVNLEAQNSCPADATVSVRARRGVESALLFVETGSSCVFAFECKNEANLLKIGEVVTVSAQAAGYTPVALSLRIQGEEQTLTIPMELESSSEQEEQEAVVPEENPTPPQVVEENMTDTKKTPLWLIILLCVACALVVIVCGVLLYVYCKKPKQKQTDANKKGKSSRQCVKDHANSRSASQQSQLLSK